MLVGAKNEFLGIILIKYMFKYWFRLNQNNFAIVTSELNNPFKGSIGKTSYKDLIFARGEFLQLVRAQNKSLRPIIIYYGFN